MTIIILRNVVVFNQNLTNAGAVGNNEWIECFHYHRDNTSILIHVTNLLLFLGFVCISADINRRLIIFNLDFYDQVSTNILH